jgi:hypothetical protein
MAQHGNPPHDDPHAHEFPERNPNVAHDPGVEDVRAVSGFGIGLAIGVIIVVFMMWGMFEWFYAREDRANPVVTPAVQSEKPQQPPEPRLQAQPRLDLRALHEGEEQILSSYAWVDPNRGIVRIPIDQAIKIVASKGLPSKPSVDLPDPNGYTEIPSKASSGRTLEKISQ